MLTVYYCWNCYFTAIFEEISYCFIYVFVLTSYFSVYYNMNVMLLIHFLIKVFLDLLDLLDLLVQVASLVHQVALVELVLLDLKEHLVCGSHEFVKMLTIKLLLFYKAMEWSLNYIVSKTGQCWIIQEKQSLTYIHQQVTYKQLSIVSVRIACKSIHICTLHLGKRRILIAYFLCRELFYS